MPEYYIKAFKQFSKAKDEDFKYAVREYGIYFHWEGQTFIVRHYDDFRADYRWYFEKRSYDEIYTETPWQLWHKMLTEQHVIPLNDLIIELYRQWRLFWEDERKHIPNENWYEVLQQRSWRNFQILIEAVKIDQGRAVVDAGNICDIELIPILAFVIREQYKDFEEFLEACVDNLLDEAENLLPIEGDFKIVHLKTPGRSRSEYCIYNDGTDFKFLMAEDLKEKRKQKAALKSKKSKKTQSTGQN